ncbi:MAG: hypothetical protein WDN08_05385 [Rhizomicrobium sp.]
MSVLASPFQAGRLDHLAHEVGHHLRSLVVAAGVDRPLARAHRGAALLETGIDLVVAQHLLVDLEPAAARRQDGVLVDLKSSRVGLGDVQAVVRRRHFAHRRLDRRGLIVCHVQYP